MSIDSGLKPCITAKKSKVREVILASIEKELRILGICMATR
jgi:hypothetical protein